MTGIGIDISKQYSKSTEEFRGKESDLWLTSATMRERHAHSFLERTSFMGVLKTQQSLRGQMKKAWKKLGRSEMK